MTRELWKRCYRLRMGEIVFDSRRGETIHFDFEVSKTLYSQANTASLTFYNLNESHRTALAQFRETRRRIRLEISAGYGEDPSLLFIGDVRPVGFKDYGEGTETITTVEGTDWGDRITENRVSRTYPEGTDLRTPVRDLVAALSLGEGNLSEMGALTLGSYTSLPRPYTFHGLASAELSAYLTSLGFTWSVQNGALQVLRNGSALNRRGILLNPSTGLIGAAYEDRRTVKIQSFLIPEISPGRNVLVESVRVNGVFRVHSVKFSGQVEGDWTSEVECRIPRPITPY